jgi:hypothetical protein
MLGQVLLETEKQSLAYPIYKLLTQLDPKRPEIWINMGKAAGELHRYEEEEKYFKKALKFANEQGNEAVIFLATQNLATNAVHQTNPDKALYWGNRALAIKENNQSRIDIGFAQLLKYEFKEGWKNYNKGIGNQKFRDVRRYRDEPEWDGSDGKRLIIYEEQGLGDQIAFSECIKEIRRKAKSVILHVNPKLKNLFHRSFLLETHGRDEIKWAESVNVDASASMAKIQEYYRDDIDKYIGKPFLIADTFQRIQWRALFDELGDKPKVGIAWTGGMHHTQQDARSTTLENLLPILTADVTWISLEYKNRSEEIAKFEKDHGIRIYDFPRATQTDDYDDTAGLVAELDLVISVPTSVVHLAGGLGVECWCITHPHPHFMFGIEGRRMPYHKSVEIFRRDKGWEPLEEIRGRLDEMRSGDTLRSWPRKDIRDGSSIRSNSGNGQGTIHEDRHIGCQ